MDCGFAVMPFLLVRTFLGLIADLGTDVALPEVRVVWCPLGELFSLHIFSLDMFHLATTAEQDAEAVPLCLGLSKY